MDSLYIVVYIHNPFYLFFVQFSPLQHIHSEQNALEDETICLKNEINFHVKRLLFNYFLMYILCLSAYDNGCELTLKEDQ